MSDGIDYLAARRQSASSSMPLEHPAGVTLPFDAPTDAALIAPEIRDEICSGAYSADLVRRLPDAVIPGDRVLVIGGGLGVVSTLVARVEGVDRVIVAEPNTALFPYIDRVHYLNGVSEVETINAVLAVGKKGKIQFCPQRDPRTSLLTPHNQSRQQAMMVPFIDLNMILAEERINLIICDTPTPPAQLLAQAELGQVDRILLNYGNDVAQCWDRDGVCTQLVARGYYPEPSGTAILLRRSVAQRSGSTRVAAPANLNSAPGLANLDSIDCQHGRF
jgi:FkbM family methyltransferase